MKKTPIFMAMAAVMTLASCSQEEPALLTAKNDKISFRSAMGTRSTETTNANLTSINVAAFLGNSTFFGDMPFTKGSDSFFTSDPEYNWPGDDSELSFYAYAPANPGGEVTLTPDTKTLTGFSPAATMDRQIDFVTSFNTGKRSENEAAGVELTFDHRLSQIEIHAKADNEAYIFKISGVRIGNPVSKADFDFATSEWTLGTEKAIYEETCDEVTLTPDEVSIMGTDGNAILIPQQLTAWNPAADSINSAEGAYLSVKLEISTKDGAQVYPFPSDATGYAWAAIPVNTNWEAGKRYIYTLDLSKGAGHQDPKGPQPGTPVLGGPIKFTVQVTDWADAQQNVSMKPADNSESDN